MQKRSGDRIHGSQLWYALRHAFCSLFLVYLFWVESFLTRRDLPSEL